VIVVPAVLAVTYAVWVERNQRAEVQSNLGYKAASPVSLTLPPSPHAPQMNLSSAKELDYFQRLRNLDEIKNLDPIAFEKLVARLFTQMGYYRRNHPCYERWGSGPDNWKGNRKGVVQCKRYKNTVGQPVVRDLYGEMIHRRADEAYLITTATITLPAQQWASDKPMHLIDGNMLIEWINTLNPQGW